MDNTQQALQQAREALDEIVRSIRGGGDIVTFSEADTSRYEAIVAALSLPVEAPSEGVPQIGDYVLATKWSDGDPGDNWAVGFYAGTVTNGGQARHLVNDNDGQTIRANGFRRVGVIRKDVGRWLLEVAAKQLEQSPPGTVNLWTMLTALASPSEGIAGDAAYPMRDGYAGSVLTSDERHRLHIDYHTREQADAAQAWLAGDAAPQEQPTEAERFCNSHCTWRDHHKDCHIAGGDKESVREQAVAWCPEKRKPGGCQLHNLHCSYPACDQPPKKRKKESGNG